MELESGNLMQRSPFLKRLFKRDCTRFKRYIEATTAHGVVHIFIGKSYIRRVLWLIIVLASASGCLYNCVDRIRFLAGAPTATAITLDRRQEINFPAVTICNLNMLRRDYLEELGLIDIVQQILISAEEGLDTCNQSLSRVSNLSNITYKELFIEGKDALESLIIGCNYLGKNCSADYATFVPTLTRLGICYVFNSGFDGREVLTTTGTGARLGLRLLINISHSQYAATPNLDAGVKVAIHRQSEPPEPDDQGIGVPTGTNAFINIRQLNIVDDTGASCNPKDQVSELNFLRQEFNYSAAACANDCFYTQIAHACNCVISDEYVADKQPYQSFPLCRVEDMCCVLAQQTTAVSCPCLPSCNSTFYQLTTSYSTFPAQFFATGDLANAGNDLLTTNIFYESLSITEQVTSSSYNVVSLLSDIGGQLGLFLGMSVISLMEFFFWVVDETKDRCLGVSERNIKTLFCRRKNNEDIESSGSALKCVNNHQYYTMTSTAQE